MNESEIWEEINNSEYYFISNFGRVKKSKNGLFIEMKYGKGKQSENQINFQKKCEEENYKYEVCNSFEKFKEICKDYLTEK